MPTIDDVSRTIGSLETSVQVIGEQQEKMHDSIEALRADMSEMKHSVKLMQEKVDRLIPVADKVTRWEQRIFGVALFGSLTGGAGVAAFFEKMKQWLWG